jgi:hypothetical protein
MSIICTVWLKKGIKTMNMLMKISIAVVVVAGLNGCDSTINSPYLTPSLWDAPIYQQHPTPIVTPAPYPSPSSHPVAGPHINVY